jgi:hypothetical protein
MPTATTAPATPARASAATPARVSTTIGDG